MAADARCPGHVRRAVRATLTCMTADAKCSAAHVRLNHGDSLCFGRCPLAFRTFVAFLPVRLICDQPASVHDHLCLLQPLRISAFTLFNLWHRSTSDSGVYSASKA